MSTLEQQLKASIDMVQLRKMAVRDIVSLRKAIDAELIARKEQLRRDAAELSSAGVIVAPRAKRKDAGKKRQPRAAVRLVRSEPDDVLQLNAIDADAEAAQDAAEAEDERQRALFEMEQAGRNEP